METLQCAHGTQVPPDIYSFHTRSHWCTLVRDALYGLDTITKDDAKAAFMEVGGWEHVRAARPCAYNVGGGKVEAVRHGHV